MDYLIPGPNLGRLKAAVEAFKQFAAEIGWQIEITILQREAIENDLGVLAERYTVLLAAPPGSRRLIRSWKSARRIISRRRWLITASFVASVRLV